MELLWASLRARAWGATDRSSSAVLQPQRGLLSSSVGRGSCLLPKFNLTSCDLPPWPHGAANTASKLSGPFPEGAGPGGGVDWGLPEGWPSLGVPGGQGTRIPTEASSGHPSLPMFTDCLGAGPVLGRTCLHSFFSVPLRPPSGFPQLASHHLPRRKANDDKFAFSQLHAGLRPCWDTQEAVGLHTSHSQVSNNLLPSTRWCSCEEVHLKGWNQGVGLCRAGGRLGAGLRACSVHSAQA